VKRKPVRDETEISCPTRREGHRVAVVMFLSGSIAIKSLLQKKLQNCSSSRQVSYIDICYFLVSSFSHEFMVVTHCTIIRRPFPYDMTPSSTSVRSIVCLWSVVIFHT
jgi:hypothetical protein